MAPAAGELVTKALKYDGRRPVLMDRRDGEHGGEFWGEEFPLMVAWAFGS